MLLYAHILHEQLKQQKKRQDLFSISPPDSDFVDPHDGIGSGRKEKEQALSPSRYGSRAICGGISKTQEGGAEKAPSMSHTYPSD